MHAGHAAAWSVQNADQTTPEIAVAATHGTGSSSSLAVGGSGGLLLDMAGWVKDNATVAVPTPTAGQTITGTERTDRSFGLGDMGSGAGRGGSDPATWSFGATGSAAWLAVGVRVRGS